MRHQSIGAKVFLAIILFFQAETSQARTTQSCPDCTSKSCKDADDKEWCVKNCNLGEIPDCLKATPEIKSEDEANRYGDIQRLELLHKIYEKYPLSKYFLELQASEEPGRKAEGTLSDDEKGQLKNALNELATGCQGVVQQLEYIKGSAISAKEQIEKLNQMKALSTELNKNISTMKTQLSASSSSPSTRVKIKRAFNDIVGLNLKNCFQLGEGAIFKANQKERFLDKVVTKFNCRECTAKNCAKTLESEYILVARTQPFQKKDKPVKGRIYLKIVGGKLTYTVLAPDEKVVSENLDITIDGALTDKKLKENKSEILTGISQKGHITTAYDNCREKCPAYRIESCLEAGSKARSSH